MELIICLVIGIILLGEVIINKMGLIIWLVIGIILLAIIGLGWNTFLAGVKKGADKLGLTSVINKAEQSFKNPNSTFQIGSNGHWVSTAKGYSKPSTF